MVLVQILAIERPLRQKSWSAAPGKQILNSVFLDFDFGSFGAPEPLIRSKRPARKQILDSVFLHLDFASFDAPKLMIRSETASRNQILDSKSMES